MSDESATTTQQNDEAIEYTRPSHVFTRTGEPLPHLHTPHRKRKFIIIFGVAAVTLDLAGLPITYYYALKFDTNLSLQEVFGVLTGIFGLISFTHYFFRSLKLFLRKTSPKWRPVGWTRWGLLEFLQVNILIIITLVEIELVVGTIPNHPIVRLCAMPSATICFYLGFLSIGSAILTMQGKKLPFNMSSTEKGQPWKPALLAFIEDAGGIEGQGGVEYRKQVLKRYDASPQFRSMIMALSWIWGIGFICIAIVSTVLIMELNEDVGFGVGWGLPWAWAAGWAVLTVFFVKNRLDKERDEWRTKEAVSVESSVA